MKKHEIIRDIGYIMVTMGLFTIIISDKIPIPIWGATMMVVCGMFNVAWSIKMQYEEAIRKGKDSIHQEDKE